MSRSGYSEYDGEQWALIRWRGAVKSAIIAPALAREIMFENDFENDMDFCLSNETPEQRWSRMREWITAQLPQEPSP